MNQIPPEKRSSTGSMTKILRFYDLYIWMNLVWYLLVLFIGVTAVRIQLPAEDFTPPVIATMRVGGAMLIMIGVICFGLSLKLKNPERTKAGWTAAFINICFGISTCLLTPFCIFLALAWNREEFKAEFIQEKFQL